MNIDKLTYKMRILFTCVVSIGMTAGCNDAYEQQSTDNEASSFISVHTNVDSKVGEDDAERAQLLFWDEETFHGAWIQNQDEKVASPRFVSTLDNEIDYYSKKTGIAFNTNEKYPAGEDATIHATGYYPAVALSPDDDYSQLLVKQGYLTGKVAGKVDFMTCDGCLEHSASREYPFTNSDKELKFRHLMACIRFRGERDKSMENIVGVKNVNITVYNKIQSDDCKQFYLPLNFKLFTYNSETNSEDKSTYIIGGYSPAPDEITIEYPGIINMGEQRELGACYVVSHGLNYDDPSSDNYVDPFGETKFVPKNSASTPKLEIEVTAYFYSISGGQTASTTETWNLVIEGDKWYDDNNNNTCTTGDKFIPGYMYDILLHFKRSGVTVKAEAVPWEDGGIHVHPVQPKTNP